MRIDWMDGIDIHPLLPKFDPENISDDDKYNLTMQFIESDFFKRLFLPMVEHEARNALLSEYNTSDPNLKVQWCEYRKAWWILVNGYLNQWLNPPPSTE